MLAICFINAGGHGLFTSNGTTTTTIALSSGPTFSIFGNVPSINAAGKLGFLADRDAGGTGLFTSDGTTTTTIALVSLTYSNFVSNTSLDTAGRLAFNAGLQAGGRGLFISDGTTTTQVLHTGDALFGSTVLGFAIGREALNDAGQLAFQYTLADGRNGVALATPILAGDYNHDNVVDAADYVLWRKNPSTYGGNPAGYNTWRANFDQPPGSGSGSAGSASAAVPEPTASVLLLSTIASLSFLRRRGALRS